MDLNISFTKLFFSIELFFFLLFFSFEDVNCFVLNAKIFLLFISICFPVSNKLRYSLKNKSTSVQWPG